MFFLCVLKSSDEFKAIASALHRDTPYGLQPDESQAADAFWARQRHIKNSMRYEYIRQPIDDLDSTNEIKNEKKKQAKAPGHASNNWIRMMDLMVGAGAIGVAIFVFIGLTKFLENRNTQQYVIHFNNIYLYVCTCVCVAVLTTDARLTHTYTYTRARACTFEMFYYNVFIRSFS